MLALSVWYLQWLLAPERVGNPVLYGALLAAELFNLAQAAGFWWTALSAGRPRAAAGPGLRSADRVDVLIPVYNEGVEIVEPTVAAACKLLGAAVEVTLCDDGDRDEMAALAARHGAAYLRRASHHGAKAGNLNHALSRTDAPFVAVFDCDHVPDSRFLEATLGHMDDPDVAFVQTPQYYANAGTNPVAAASWSQQALFFGVIARGKDALEAMFCCGTNMVFRREALAGAGGFPEESVTEDFELSIRLRSEGWRSVYVPEVLAQGLGPEDMASYVTQQDRWARGCLSGIATAWRSPLPWRQKAQFILSSMYFLTGWTYLLYMMLPVVRLLAGQQAIAAASADQFLLHFIPYFAASMLVVAAGGAGRYTFAAFALMESSFWVHVHAAIANVLRRTAGFRVTPKVGSSGRQPRAVLPALIALGVLVAAVVDGLLTSQTPATLNNVSFAGLHVAVLVVGVWPAIAGNRRRHEQY
ncbi:MAG: glycosyltransferase family 2 protein [Acidimicrobiales bacterium]